jgi:hypothetical protein
MQIVNVRSLSRSRVMALSLAVIALLCSCDLYRHRNENLRLRDHLIKEFVALKGITVTTANLNVVIRKDVTKLIFSEFRKIDEIKEIVAFVSNKSIFPERFHPVPIEVRFFSSDLVHLNGLRNIRLAREIRPQI